MLIENSKLLRLTENLRDNLKSKLIEDIDDFNFRTSEFNDTIQYLANADKAKFSFVDNRIWFGTTVNPKMNLLQCAIKPRNFHDEFNIYTRIGDISNAILKHYLVDTISPFKCALEIQKIGSELIEIKNLFNVDRILQEYDMCIKKDILFNMRII